MERPFVYLNMASSVDGKITSARREYPTFTSRHDKRTMDRLRARADAILVGAGTIRADDPPLGVRDAGMLEYRRSLGKPDGLTHVVVSAGLDLDLDSRFFRDPSADARIVATVEGAAPDRVRAVEELAEVWRVGRDRIDPVLLLSRLHERGVARLLLEGGGELNWSLVQAGLVDEIYVTIAPCLLGGRDAPTLLEGEGFPMDRRAHLRLADVERHEDELYCRYEVVR